MTQALLNGLVSGLLIALPAIALSLTYGILNFANFSIGAMITTGAYLAYIANTSLGAPIAVAAPAAAIGLALVAIAIQHGVYRRIRNADHVTLLVASMGVAFVLENVLRFFYGADVRTLDVPVARPLIWNGLRLNHEQLTIAAVALSAMVVVAFILKRTRLGRAMRAISDDPDLAEVRGIGRAATVDWTWAISGVLTALAGVLIALDGVVDPMMGTNYLVSVFAAAVIGGIGNPFGAVAGALIIGLVEETSALAVSTTYRQGVSFAVLVLVLLLRPQGLVGAGEDPAMTGYFIAILTFVSLAVLLGFALNVQWGQAGMLNFGLAGFYGIGAYTAAILSKAGVDGLTATAAAMAMTAALSALVSLATLKLREDYLAITTLAFAELVRLVLTNETWLTGGTNGIRDIPRPLIGLVGGDQYELFFLLLCLALVAATYLVLDRIIRSPLGRALRAVREDDVVAATLGKNVLALRVKAFAIGGAVIGLAGALHAYYFTYIDPGEFAGFVTVYAFMAVIVGGKGSNRGLLLGACTVMVLLEGTRFLKDFVPLLSAQQAASLRLALIGAGLVLILIFRPEGISSEYRLSIAKSPHPDLGR